MINFMLAQLHADTLRIIDDAQTKAEEKECAAK